MIFELGHVLPSSSDGFGQNNMFEKILASSGLPRNTNVPPDGCSSSLSKVLPSVESEMGDFSLESLLFLNVGSHVCLILFLNQISAEYFDVVDRLQFLRNHHVLRDEVVFDDRLVQFAILIKLGQLCVAPVIDSALQR